MTVYHTRGWLLPGRHRPRREPGPWLRFLRAVAAIALGAGGLWAGLLGFVLASVNAPVPACYLAVLCFVLLATSTWLALPAGEAWQRITGGAG